MAVTTGQCTLPMTGLPKGRRYRVRTETEFMRRVVNLAGWTGWLVHHDMPAPGADGRWRVHGLKGMEGFPDLLLVRDGVIHAWELKDEARNPEPEQIKWGEAFGPVFRLLRPSDWPWIEQTLKTPRPRKDGGRRHDPNLL